MKEIYYPEPYKARQQGLLWTWKPVSTSLQRVSRAGRESWNLASPKEGVTISFSWVPCCPCCWVVDICGTSSMRLHSPASGRVGASSDRAELHPHSCDPRQAPSWIKIMIQPPPSSSLTLTEKRLPHGFTIGGNQGTVLKREVRKKLILT